jgi:hypothetical protein
MNAEPDDTPIDLTALAGMMDHDGDRFTASVKARVASAGASRPSRIDPLWGLWSMWRGLALTGAALVLLLLGARARVEPPPPATVAESLGVPPEFRALTAAQVEGGIR